MEFDSVPRDPRPFKAIKSMDARTITYLVDPGALDPPRTSISALLFLSQEMEP